MAPCACRAILPVSNDSLRPPISKLTCSNILHILFPGSPGATIRETSLGICDLLKKTEEQPKRKETEKGNGERRTQRATRRSSACRPACSPTTPVCAEESAACAAAQGICAICAN